MLRHFLSNNRADLAARCTLKVAMRPSRNASHEQLDTGVPLFLEQLIHTLEAEHEGKPAEGMRISGPPGGDRAALSEMGLAAAIHGKALLALGYSVDQVVHDYGDLCQSICDLARERDAPFSIDEYRTLNRCLDNAIADAVAEFSAARDADIRSLQASDGNQRMGFLMHELRNALSAASLAVEAMRSGKLPVDGATGDLLSRSHAAMARLIERSLAEVKSENLAMDAPAVFPLADLLRDAHEAGQLDADARGLRMNVGEVDQDLAVKARRDLLLAAIANLVGNALKFTLPNTSIELNARAENGRVLIEVRDHCGGLRRGDEQRIFIPFSQRGDDRSGMGLGLSIARESVRADGGTLTVRDLPGEGCVFTINLARRSMSEP